MKLGENFHSQLVGWSKILLPISALALLSTLFLLARAPSAPTDIPIAEIEAIARDQRITAPQFSGITEDGSIIAISARSAKPDMTREDTILIEEISMQMDSVNGNRIDISAIEGEIDGSAGLAKFLGLTRLVTSDGYEMEVTGLVAELDTGQVTSNGQLEIHAPFGELTAGQVTFKVSRENTGQQMLFTQGVRLIYQPPEQP